MSDNDSLALRSVFESTEEFLRFFRLTPEPGELLVRAPALPVATRVRVDVAFPGLESAVVRGEVMGSDPKSGRTVIRLLSGETAQRTYLLSIAMGWDDDRHAPRPGQTRPANPVNTRSPKSAGLSPLVPLSAMLSEETAREQRVPAWGDAVFRETRATLGHEGFPCVFARKANQRNNLYFVFLESGEDAELHRLCAALIEYLAKVRVAETALDILPLLVFFKPEPEPIPLAEYHAKSWRILQWLLDADPAPWPEHTPKDHDNPLWSFCFGGEQVFVNVSCPSHKQRRSRHLNSAMTFIIQRRVNFDLVAPAGTRHGDQIRKTIQSRQELYDGIPSSPVLLAYGDTVNHEWKIYMMSETNDRPAVTQCPLRHRTGGVR